MGIFKTKQMSYTICGAGTTVGLLLFLTVETSYGFVSNTENNVTDGLNYRDQRTDNNGVNFTEYGFNFTSLIYEYVLVCGFENLCYPHRLPYYVNLTTPFVRLLECTTCSCRSDCLKSDNCCPDKAKELFMLECVDARIMTSSKISNTNTKKSHNGFKVIDKCFLQDGKLITSNCSDKNETTMDSLTNMPVVSKEGISYRNKHCAECNGISNFTFWELDIDCEIFTDFNYISSYEELIDVAEKRSCQIKYQPVADVFYHGCTTTPEAVQSEVNTCNVTGGWQVYNQDIEKACLSQYVVPYQQFKNIFCFICNPKPRENQLIIPNCNYTGKIKSNDHSLEKACETFSSSEVLWPFKNIFCYLCNNRMARNLHFKDSIVNIMEGVSNRTWGLYYRIEITKFKYSFFIKIHKKIRSNQKYSNVSAENAVMQQEKSDKITNIAKLIEYGFATNETFRYCYDPNSSRLLPFSNPGSNWCYCNYACLFSNKECCANIPLRITTTCFNDTISSAQFIENDDTKYLAVQDCKDTFEGTPLQSRCHHNSTDDIFTFLPVSIDGVTYRNFDCLICNEFNRPNNIQFNDLYRSEQPWDIEIFCEIGLEYDVLDTIIDIIHLAKRMNCSLKYNPPKSNQQFSKVFEPKTCGHGSDLISRCNVTGKWMKYDHDIALACESLEEHSLPTYKPFKNIYCFLCNPNISVDATVSSCNETGKWDIYNQNVEKACKTLPYISSLNPYKNMFCKLCNQKTNITLQQNSGRSAISFGGITQVTGNYRNLFGLPSQYGTSNEEESTTVKCGDKDIYNSNKNGCRQIKCYPGRFLQNSTCYSLFNSASNMKYTLAYSITGEIMASNHTMLDNLRNITRQLKKSIESALGTNYVEFSTFYLVSNMTCTYDVILKSAEMVILHIYTSLYIPGSIKRQEAEMSLLELKRKPINFYLNKENVSFSTYKDDVAYRIPSLVNRWDFQQKCFVMKAYGDVKSHNTHRNSFVSMLLICNQIELEPEEFSIDAFQTALTVKSSKAIFSYDEFYLPGNGRARICMDLFNERTSSDVDILDIIINIISLICTCISMICLLVTFVTYCMFQSLRSLPGKNNMSLVAAMFFAQGFLQFGLKQTDNSYVCIVIGILIHYFWLNMFFCLNICTFHMYRVFCHDVVTFSNTHQNKTFIRYLCFSYGMPFIIVMTKLGIFYLSTRTFGYGGNTCFMSEIISYVLSFLLPILVICVFNIILFGCAIHKIKNSPNVQSNASSRRDMWTYLKLFSITGITWILIIIDSFFSVSFFSVIVGLLSGLQGLFIMSSYIINKRVKLLYKNMFQNTKCCIVSRNDNTLTESGASGTESTKVSSPKVTTKN